MRKHKQKRLHSSELTVPKRIGLLSLACGSWQHLPAVHGLLLANTASLTAASSALSQPLHWQKSALSFWFFLLLKVVLLAGLGDLGRFSFPFIFPFFFFFGCCCYLLVFLILDAVTGFCSTSLHEQAAPLRDFTAFKGHRTATMVKCLV